MDFKHLTTVGAALVLGTALSGNLQAMPLLPDETLTNPDEGLPPGNGGFYTSGSPDAIGGALYGDVVISLDHRNSPMVGAFTGNVESWVYGNDATDPTQMLFVYKFTMAQGEDDPDLIRATIGDSSHPWAGIGILDAGADGSGASGDPANDEWTDGDPNFLLRDPPGQEGLSIQWRALSGGTTLQESDMSSLIWYLVESNDFTTTNVGLLDSGSVGTSSALAPVIASVPEPTTLALLGLGLAAGIGVVRRRRKIS